MQENAAALDMTEETVAEAHALMRAFDQAGKIRHHEFAPVHGKHAELRMQCGERIIRDFRFGRADGGEECRLARVGQSDQTRIRDQFQAQANGALFARLAGIGVARRAVGRRLLK